MKGSERAINAQNIQVRNNESRCKTCCSTYAEKTGTIFCLNCRTHLTMQLFSCRLIRKTLVYSKALEMCKVAAVWYDGYYNLTYKQAQEPTP